MPRLSSRCKIAVVFLLALLLATAWASAAGSRGWAEPRVQQLPAVSLWDLIWEAISGLWPKAGASPDPNGSATKNGGSADPNGSAIKAGGSLDPSGNPTSQPAPTTPTTNSDAGGSLDPNG